MKTIVKKLIPILVVTLVAGCGSKSVDFLIDNPTDKALKLRIDDTNYDIPAHQSTAVAMKAGEHSMDAPSTGKLKFVVYADRQGGLVNPTLSDYVIVSEAFVTGESKLKNFSPAGGGPFQLDGVTYNGPFKLVNSLFIDKDWRFGLNEPFPSSATGYDAGMGGNIFRKIFRAPEFVSYAETRYVQPGYFEKERQHLSPEPRKVSGPPPLPEFSDPDLQQASLKLRELCQRYRHAADTDEQKRLQGEYNKLTMDFVSFAAPRLGSQPTEQRVKYNNFIQQTGNIMGSSAMVED